MANNDKDRNININTTGLNSNQRIKFTYNKDGRISEMWKEDIPPKKQDDCWVVTACYGRSSSELRYVKAACRRQFALNPFMSASWGLYKLIGHRVAEWAKVNERRKKFAMKFIAYPIYQAAQKFSFKSLFFKTYLVLLSIGSLFTVAPLVLLDKLISFFTKK